MTKSDSFETLVSIQVFQQSEKKILQWEKTDLYLHGIHENITKFIFSLVWLIVWLCRILSE